MSCGCGPKKTCNCGKHNCSLCKNASLHQQSAAMPSLMASQQQQKNDDQKLSYDFWQETADVEEGIRDAETQRNPMANYWALDNLIDEEKIEELGPEYEGRQTEQQRNLAFANLPTEQAVQYWGQRLPAQPGHIEHLSMYASQNGYFWDDPWDRMVYQQQFKHWEDYENQLAHSRDVQNFWMR
uniref:Uncharacterized protein n=1 Tax=Clandestinovirus TaxID=2831644 RepID=A0A8F8KTZ2_9VIRU|nr:hypothetical protein KOM_12_334 [Clandestinovirus]